MIMFMHSRIDRGQVRNRPKIRVERQSPQMPANCRCFSDKASDIYCVTPLHSKSEGCGAAIVKRDCP